MCDRCFSTPPADAADLYTVLVIVSLIVACIGLASPLVIYLNNRFTPSTARASRLESLSKTIDSLPVMSTDYLALTHVRHQLILDEHYRVYGPKENRYINALLVLNALLGLGGIINVYFDIDEFRYVIIGQGAIMVVVFILTLILNRKHDRYMEDFKAFLPDSPSETE